MTRLIEALKRKYQNGDVTVEQVQGWKDSGIITEEEKGYILG